jgi:predicted ATP-binding protein involved in virulence
VQIELEKLSSGEQHLLVLFGQLLFCDDGGLVLVDEPELSLHLAWQERFLEYLAAAQRLAGFTAILATHSPGIIDDRWDLTVELAEATRVVDEV